MTPSLRHLFVLFLRVGNLTFGGGDPTMAVLYREMVVNRHWLTPERYGLIYGLARVTPGTNLLAFCAGVGWHLLRWPGAATAVFAVAAPCSVAVVWFTIGYNAWKSNPLAMAAIGGTLAAAVGLMASAAFHLIRPHWKPRRRFRALVIAGGSLALSVGLGLSPVQVLALGAFAGLVWRTPAES